jgi:hypothetical protein
MFSDSVRVPNHRQKFSKALRMPQFLQKCGLLLMALLLGGFQENLALDFRIENRVFAEGKTEPQSRSLTLFHDGMVYDFMSDPAEVTVFDKATGRFVLLNMAKQEQTELSLADLDAFMEKLKQLANKQKDPLSKFFASPKFEERFDPANGELSLSSPWVTYHVITEATKNSAISDQYRQFSDWYARLNAMLNVGSRPPLARLQVNDALARHESLARQVTFTLSSVEKNALQKTVLRSEHDFMLSLTSSDLDQIQKAQEARGKFKLVSYDTYRKHRNTER